MAQALNLMILSLSFKCCGYRHVLPGLVPLGVGGVCVCLSETRSIHGAL